MSCNGKETRKDSRITKVTIDGTKDCCYHSPSWSPDGKQLAFTRKSALYLTDQNGKNITHLKGFNLGQSYLEWSLDSRYLAMILRNKITYFVGVLDLETRKMKKFLKSYWMVLPSWTYLGKKGFVSVLNGAGQIITTPPFEIYNHYPKKMQRKVLYHHEKGLLYLDENDSVKTKERTFDLSLSADKNYLVFEKNQELIIVNLNTEDSTVVENPFGKEYYFTEALFSYDNSKIICNLAYDLKTDDHFVINDYDIAIYDIKTKVFKRVTNTRDQLEMTPCLSPDNKKIAYANRTDGNIYILNLEKE